MITDYTTFADVRALLGVNDIELSDATLALEVYSHSLTAELEEVDVGLPAKFVEVADTDDSAWTTAQRRFFESCRLFSAYAVAKQATTALPMFGPKDVGDSKAVISRFSDSPYKQTEKKIKEGFDLQKTRLAKAYADLNTTSTTTATPRTMLVISSPTTDRVTG